MLALSFPMIYFDHFIPACQELAPPNVTLDTHSLQLLRGVCQTPAKSLVLQNQLVLLPCHTLKVVLKVVTHRRHQQFLQLTVHLAHGINEGYQKLVS